MCIKVNTVPNNSVSASMT